MIEVVPAGNRWTWRMICAAGRVLVAARDTYPCDLSAFLAAKEYRTAFWALADQIDHRMGRCI